jgi:hypothetical protein
MAVKILLRGKNMNTCFKTKSSGKYPTAQLGYYVMRNSVNYTSHLFNVVRTVKFRNDDRVNKWL